MAILIGIIILLALPLLIGAGLQQDPAERTKRLRLAYILFGGVGVLSFFKVFFEIF